MLHHTTYRHSNSSQWVTFIHGAGGSSTIWYKQIREFKKQYNVLLLDLRGHGESRGQIFDAFNQKYTFEQIANDVIEVLDHLQIKQSHFVGVSLGTIIIRQIAEMRPQLVSSMIMGGAIMKMNIRARFLMKLGNIFKSVVPYLWLYRFFAFVIMPKRNHRESRSLFVEEAKKLYQKEFQKWFRLTAEINPLLRFFRSEDIHIPTLYIMGEEDHMFLPAVKKVVADHGQSWLKIVEDCGHVVNVEEPVTFNQFSLQFLNNQ